MILSWASMPIPLAPNPQVPPSHRLRRKKCMSQHPTSMYLGTCPQGSALVRKLIGFTTRITRVYGQYIIVVAWLDEPTNITGGYHIAAPESFWDCIWGVFLGSNTLSCARENFQTSSNGILNSTGTLWYGHMMRTSLGCDITNNEDDVRYTDDTDKRI